MRKQGLDSGQEDQKTRRRNEEEEMATKATSNQGRKLINQVVGNITPHQIKEKEEELQSTMLQKRLILIKRRQLQILFAIGDIFRKRKNASIKKSIRR